MCRYCRPAVQEYLPWVATRIEEPPPVHLAVGIVEVPPHEVAQFCRSEESFIKPGIENHNMSLDVCIRNDSVLGETGEGVADLRRPGACDVDFHAFVRLSCSLCSGSGPQTERPRRPNNSRDVSSQLCGCACW